MTYLHTHEGAAAPHTHEGVAAPHTHDQIPMPGASGDAGQAHPSELHRIRQAEGAQPLMSFRDYCFAYDEDATLRHIDLDIYAGDSVVLMGYNGSGKSTLLKAMNGLVFPQRGEYFPAFAKRLHARVGFIFQDSDAQLFCSNVEDEIAFGPRQMGLTEAEVARRVDDVCALLDIDKLRGRAPYHLSGGEKKKVSIACILSMPMSTASTSP